MSNKAMDIALRAGENIQAKELGSKLSARIAASVKDVGQMDSLRHTILSHVAGEQYDRAIGDLKAYAAAKSEYPLFDVRAGRFVSYAIDLINAIRAKRSFPGLNQLAMSKQQELFDKAMSHFDDLKATIRKIETIERDVKLEDVRSTVLVVKAIVYSLFAFLILGFFLEISRGVLPTAFVVVDSSFGEITNWFFDKIGM